MAIFPYFIYKENAPNELKFGPGMYFNEFVILQKIFGKFSKLANFWPKNGHLARFPRREIVPFFRRKTYQGLQKCSEWAENQYTYSI